MNIISSLEDPHLLTKQQRDMLNLYLATPKESLEPLIGSEPDTTNNYLDSLASLLSIDVPELVYLKTRYEALIYTSHSPLSQAVLDPLSYLLITKDYDLSSLVSSSISSKAFIPPTIEQDNAHFSKMNLLRKVRERLNPGLKTEDLNSTERLAKMLYMVDVISATAKAAFGEDLNILTRDGKSVTGILHQELTRNFFHYLKFPLDTQSKLAQVQASMAIGDFVEARRLFSMIEKEDLQEIYNKVFIGDWGALVIYYLSSTDYLPIQAKQSLISIITFITNELELTYPHTTEV